MLQVLGIQIFVLPRAASKLIRHIGVWRGFSAIFTYATYDLTNWAVLKDWTAIPHFATDMCWGAVVSSHALRWPGIRRNDICAKR